MATVNFKPGRTTVTAAVSAKLTNIPPEIAALPGGLFPMRASVWRVEEYRLMAGWPVPVPTHDIRVECLVSASGEALAHRDSPTEILTGADFRWIADESYFNSDTLRWSCAQGNGLFWTGAPGYSPVLINDYEYRVGSERFSVNALNFDSDTRNFLTTNLGPVLGGLSGYTVVMAMSPNSYYENDVTVPYNGLWCPGGEDPGEYWNAFTMQGNYLWAQSEGRPRAALVSMAEILNGNAPCFVALVVNRPTITVYIGSGPSRIRSAKYDTGTDAINLNTKVYLGRTNEDLQHTADMALFDLGLHVNALNAEQVRAEFTKLSQVYGGDS